MDQEIGPRRRRTRRTKLGQPPEILGDWFNGGAGGFGSNQVMDREIQFIIVGMNIFGYSRAPCQNVLYRRRCCCE